MGARAVEDRGGGAPGDEAAPAEQYDSTSHDSCTFVASSERRKEASWQARRSRSS